MLKILEGTVANIPPKGGRKHPEQSFVQIDTTNIKPADGLFYIADQAGGFQIIDPNTPCREPFIHEIPASLPD